MFYKFPRLAMESECLREIFSQKRFSTVKEPFGVFGAFRKFRIGTSRKELGLKLSRKVLEQQQRVSGLCKIVGRENYAGTRTHQNAETTSDPPGPL